MESIQEILGYLRVVGGNSIVSGVALGHMGPGQLSIHMHGLEYLVTVHAEGVQPGDDAVPDVAGHALQVHGDPVRL